MIFPEHELIFVHIQKTGGTSVVRALGASDPNCPEKHWFAADLRGLYGEERWTRYYKFALVRNPWDRLVSWWSMINARRPAVEAGSPTNNFAGFILSRTKTFDDFLCCDQDIRDGDGLKNIYRNQVEYLTGPDGQTLVDFIGRFETLTQDYESVRGRARGVTAPLERLNPSSHAHYSEYYTPESAALVGERYARDIATFGYTFERRPNPV